MVPLSPDLAVRLSHFSDGISRICQIAAGCRVRGTRVFVILAWPAWSWLEFSPEDFRLDGFSV
jgi:hypothetical protein